MTRLLSALAGLLLILAGAVFAEPLLEAVGAFLAVLSACWLCVTAFERVVHT